MATIRIGLYVNSIFEDRKMDHLRRKIISKGRTQEQRGIHGKASGWIQETSGFYLRVCVIEREKVDQKSVETCSFLLLRFKNLLGLALILRSFCPFS